MRLVEKPTKLLWLDLETTGLEPTSGDRILEVAALITDIGLNELASYHSLVAYEDIDEVHNILVQNPFWASRSDGLKKIIKEMPSGKPIDQVEADLVALQNEHFEPDEPIYLAGNTIRLDRDFIDYFWPEFARRLHYRMLDVSSLKLWWTANGKLEYKKIEKHRALDDIRESIAELKFYSQDIDFFKSV